MTEKFEQTIYVSMTQQVKKEEEEEEKRKWRCTNSRWIFLLTEYGSRGQNLYLLTLFEDAVYTLIDCLFSFSYFHLYITSSTIHYFFFFLLLLLILLRLFLFVQLLLSTYTFFLLALNVIFR